MMKWHFPVFPGFRECAPLAQSRLRLLLVTSVLMCAVTAHAANHALIMSIGNYSDPSANLPGIDSDAARGRQIATEMGVPVANIVHLKDVGLTLVGVKTASRS